MLASVTVVGAVAIGAVAIGAGSAWGCGFLVAPNGAVDLKRTTTLAAYHDGLEHYITSFSFSGTPAAFGSIVPLPGEPTKVERGGDWTLQRQGRYTHSMDYVAAVAKDLHFSVRVLERQVLRYEADVAVAGIFAILERTRHDG